MLAPVCGDDVLHVDAAIVKFAGNGLLFAFVHHVPMHVANGRQAHQHARTIIIAQTALHPVLAVQGRIDIIDLADLLSLLLQPFLVYHRLFPVKWRKLYHKSVDYGA